MIGGSPTGEGAGRDPDDPREPEQETHRVPILGGPDEDGLIRERLREGGRRLDGATFLAELLAREDDETPPNERR